VGADERAERLPAAPPTADALLALPDDLWRAVVPHLRRVLTDLPEAAATPQSRRLAATPATRLGSGRVRGAASRLLAEGGAAWLDLRRRLLEDGALGVAVADALAMPTVPTVMAPPPSTDRDAEAARLRERVREALRDRDAAVRRAEGAEARAAAAEAALMGLESERDDLRDRINGLVGEVEAARRDSAAAAERERRRQAGEISQLRSELKELRRAEEDRRRRRREEQRKPPTAPPPTTTPRAAATATPRVVPGRPSRLPPGMRPDTTEGVDALLHRDRLVLVDGYNVTRTQRADLDLEGQRRWLVDRLAAARAARGIEVVVVFDGDGPEISSRRDRGVRVTFTPRGHTADDDLVFQVAALPDDRPVVVVTDDRELRDRLRPYGVDLVRTGQLLQAIG
jgi:predicted RNA-binding protein with PIN domain